MSDTETEPSDSELHPLFWSKVPEDGNKEVDNMKNSLTNMIYDNKSPLELALDFKENGNEAFKRGKKYFSSAIKYYEEGLDWIKQENNSTATFDVKVKILSNLALIKFKQKNYGACISYCEEILKISKSQNEEVSRKVFYRLGQANFSLGKYVKAKRYLKQVSFEKDVLDEEKLQQDLFKKLEEKINTKIKEQKVKKDAKVREKLQVKKREKVFLDLMASKGYQLGVPLFDFSLYPLESDFFHSTKIPIPKLNGSNFVFPVLIVYPEFQRTDFIQAWEENVTVKEQLDCLFPLEGKGYENLENPGIEIYYEENVVQVLDLTRDIEIQVSKIQSNVNKLTTDYKERIILNKNAKLSSVLSRESYVIPGIPVLWIINSNNEFYRIVHPVDTEDIVSFENGLFPPYIEPILDLFCFQV
eukprot:snap_masked-scaffold_19-processed-gene-6.25-mRNA-1 protein AED:1.00 eAED:1.00 QI:0/0/0/0/1/1/2/0/414